MESVSTTDEGDIKTTGTRSLSPQREFLDRSVTVLCMVRDLRVRRWFLYDVSPPRSLIWATGTKALSETAPGSHAESTRDESEEGLKDRLATSRTGSSRFLSTGMADT
jgi:hypothetical protein